MKVMLYVDSKMRFFLRWRIQLNWHYNKRFALWVPTLSTKTPPEGITLYKGNAQVRYSLLALCFIRNNNAKVVYFRSFYWLRVCRQH
jgi:hypothetical protein